MSLHLQITIMNRNAAEFRGYQARELHTSLTGRPPVWNTRSRAWVTHPSRVRDLAALAESKGYATTITGELEPVKQVELTAESACESPRPADVPDGLW